MAFNVTAFKNNGLTFGGARPTLFQVTLNLPTSISRGTDVIKKFAFTCRATSIPASTVSAIEVPYFGRKVKVAGDRTFADWNVTVINDEDFLIRDALEQWSNQINSLVGNKRLANEQVDGGYRSTAFVTQFAKGGALGSSGRNDLDVPIKAYTFWNIFPTNIDTMDLDWDNTNQLQTFGVTFSYDYWTPSANPGSGINVETGDAGTGGGTGGGVAPSITGGNLG